MLDKKYMNEITPHTQILSYENYDRKQFSSVLPIIRNLAHHCNVCLQFPMYRILKAVARRFMLNQIEALFLVYLARRSDWNINEPLITSNSHKVRDAFDFVSDQPEYKNLCLYITLLCYKLKECLNEQQGDFLPIAVKICPDFVPIFEKWSELHPDYTKQIDPKTINRLYQSCAGENVEEERDYIAMVDQILKISPPYTETRSAEYRRRVQELEIEDNAVEFIRQKPLKKVKNDFDFYPEPPATFSTEGLECIIEGGTTNDSDDNPILCDKIDELGFYFARNAYAKQQNISMPDYVPNSDEEYYEEDSLVLNDRPSQAKIVFRQSKDPFISELDINNGPYEQLLGFIYD